MWYAPRSCTTPPPDQPWRQRRRNAPDSRCSDNVGVASHYFGILSAGLRVLTLRKMALSATLHRKVAPLRAVAANVRKCKEDRTFRALYVPADWSLGEPLGSAFKNRPRERGTSGPCDRAAGREGVACPAGCGKPSASAITTGHRLPRVSFISRVFDRFRLSPVSPWLAGARRPVVAIPGIRACASIVFDSDRVDTLRLLTTGLWTFLLRLFPIPSFGSGQPRGR
jgi:hypothetical protein